MTSNIYWYLPCLEMQHEYLIFYVNLLTDRQTDRQTNARYYVTFLAELKIYCIQFCMKA